MIYSIIEYKNALTNDEIIVMDAFENPGAMLKSAFPVNSVTAWALDAGRPPKGKTYNLKKRFLISKALNYKWIIDNNTTLKKYSFNDNITDYFYKYGKKYGLLKMFKSMRII